MGLQNPNVFAWMLLGWCCFCFSMVEASHKLYENLQSIPTSSVSSMYRTGFHFQPPKNWINDPNGPMYYKGIYHLFYQYNPEGAVWGNIVWAHSISVDLVNWTPLEHAIVPSKLFDIKGCWSGSATILPGDLPVLFYTGIDVGDRQVQNLAFPNNLSDPFLRKWDKPDYNPVIAPDVGIDPSKFRDPTTAWLGPDGRWRVVIGARNNMTGVAMLYTSNDFVHWVKAKRPLHSVKDSGMWECPDFFPVAGKGSDGGGGGGGGGGRVKHVLKVSLDVTRYEYYTLGTYNSSTDKYIPDKTLADNSTGLRYDYGNFYASKTFFDAGKNRRILWGWSNESDTVPDDVAKGWAGIQTVPRELWLDMNGRQLVQWPVKELEALRRKQVKMQHKTLQGGDVLEVEGVLSAQADVEVSFGVAGLEEAEPFELSWSSDPQVLCGLKGAGVKGGVGPFGLLVLASGNLEEHTAMLFRVFKASDEYKVLMCHDPSKSSLRRGMYKPSFAGFVDVDIAKTGTLSLRTLIDHSVVESFGAGGRTCITSRVYPSLAIGKNAHLFVFNNGSESVQITKLKVWEMAKARIN